MLKINIFLVDDNRLYLEDLKLSFGSKPYYEITTFPTGEACIAKLSLKPDIIILDYYLNSVEPTAMNGLETLMKVRETLPDIPVIILTSEKNAEIAENCYRHNATEYIIKNKISFARLREIITSIFLDKSTKKDLIFHLNHALTFDKYKE